MSLNDKGEFLSKLLKEGLAADILIFDSEKVIDKGDYTDPNQYPLGINYVLVNGEQVIKDGEDTGKRSGKVLRRK